MLTVLLQAIVLASGGIVSVGSITIVILFLLSERGLQVGMGYAAGFERHAWLRISRLYLWCWRGRPEARPIA